MTKHFIQITIWLNHQEIQVVPMWIWKYKMIYKITGVLESEGWLIEADQVNKVRVLYVNIQNILFISRVIITEITSLIIEIQLV